MMTVYKYKFQLRDHVVLTLPVGARVLTFAQDPASPSTDGVMAVWALVDPDETEAEERCFRCAGTGHPIDRDARGDDPLTPERLAHVGSTFLSMPGQILVFHLFEELPA